MLPRWFIVFPLVVLAVFLGGCASDLKFAPVHPGVGVGRVQLGMPMSEVPKILGEPRIVEKTDDTLIYAYPSSAISISGSHEKAPVRTIVAGTGFEQSLPAREFYGKTPAGIAIQSPRAAVIRAYGQPDEREGSPDDFRHGERLVYDRLGITFLLRADKIVRMTVYPREQPQTMPDKKAK